MAQLNYTANVNDLYTGREPAPAGDYQVIISNSEVKVPKSGHGSMLTLELEIINHPTQSGKKVYENLCIHHPNQKAEEIARRKNNTYAAVTLGYAPNDSIEMHNKPFGVRLGVDGENNTVKKIMSLKDMGGAASSAPAQAGSENKPSFLR